MLNVRKASGYILGSLLVILVALLGFRSESSPAEPLSPANPSVQQAQALLLPVAEPNYWPIRDHTVPDPVLEAKAAGVFDLNSEKFLYVKNMDQRLPIASVTKVMTAMVILDQFDLENEIFTIQAESLNVAGEGPQLYKGERLRGVDLFKFMLIGSYNDAAVTFDTEAAKRGIDLVGEMNKKAKSLGMRDSLFKDTAGLDDSAYSTVSDLVKMVRYSRKYPLIVDTLQTVNLDIDSVDGDRNHKMKNTNRLLWEFPGVVGGKTGYTPAAMQTLTLEVAINGGRDMLISVVLGSPDRYAESARLMNWAQKAHRWK